MFLQVIFEFRKITLKNHSDKPLIISFIRISFPELGYVCDSARDSLSALFPGIIGQETVIAPKSSAATDCALYCGGIEVGQQSARYEGKMDVYGIYSDRGTTDDIPEKMTTSISIQNF